MRRKGVGSALVEVACGELRQRGHHEVTAAGAGPYLWPGIPRDICEAIKTEFDSFTARDLSGVEFE